MGINMYQCVHTRVHVIYNIESSLFTWLTVCATHVACILLLSTMLPNSFMAKKIVIRNFLCLKLWYINVFANNC